MLPLCMTSKPVVEEIKEVLKKEVQRLKNFGCNPSLVIFANNDPASQVYMKNKLKFGQEIGVAVNALTYDSAREIRRFLTDTTFPFIIQEPAIIKQEEINDILNDYQDRDADCFGSNNLGKLLLKQSSIMLPCTPYGIIELLDYYGLLKHLQSFTIIGRSKIVGKPLAILLQEYYNNTVTVCHSKTSPAFLYDNVKKAQVVISAVGKPDYFPCDFPSGKVIVDVAMNRDENGKLRGDFNNKVYEESYAYTPVPGGVGPMTVAMLFRNVTGYYWKNCEILNKK